MRRSILAALVVLLMAVAACTRTVRVEVPASPASPAGVPRVAIDDNGTRPGTVVDVVDRVLPAVVNVTASVQQVDPLGGSRNATGTGTGFIVAANGYVVTNWHVVENANEITVTTSGDDPREFEARVVGGDPEGDLAVLKVDATGLPTVPLGNSADLQLGQRVVAIGYALALEGGPSVTTGIVSAMDRVITARDENFPAGQRTYRGAIQTDAAINPGNSGGPLVDLLGRVVGINTAGPGAAQADNIGFAIAIDTARPVIRQAIEDPAAPVGYLGVVTVPVTDQLVLQENLPVQTGAYVVDLAPGGPADRAGIEPGDVVVAFGGQDVSGPDQMGSLIQAREPGERVEVTVVGPDGRERTVTATLDSRPLPVINQ